MLRAFAAAALLTISVVGCSDDDGDSSDEAATESPSPTGPSVEVPEGVTLTEPGATMDLGQPASVVYDAGNDRVSVLTVTVDKVVAGSMKRDFNSFALKPKQLRSTPYYASVTVRNAGPGPLGRAAIPLYGYDSTDTYFPSSPIVGKLDRCQGGPLPATFGPQATSQACLVFIVGDDVTLEALELRPSDEAEPIRWTVPAA